ncbi:ribonuclease HII [Propionivibrio sp.]|uniref:ribonuclease HII n=1 Tax=Propionivibrio sp. TaxID=2212460 RepID=UPI0025E615E9|nr:ribonuclease HII [Propionivibrio sp.]MBK7356518.1 ribonuclease HII [Propionivibrio sp.]MBK8400931.1 ribonuclease HII [Propionivibrio sp.]MBK8745277.1 ribonuclease HII [Propionivibrio sp.]MBK8894216.1 ribonuclease HII [Propionivibrio sp.]MBL0207659.1 ribonuclease HII [Propionivibrio sp.]
MPRLLPPEGLVCGVDEAGRGPLAGPVVAAAVILDPSYPIEGLDDSKKLSAKRRAALAIKIRHHALAWAIAEATVEEIDLINILQASLLAMRRAVELLGTPPHHALIDGNHCPQLPCTAQGIIGGDGKIASIAAASILAKTSRDADMLKLHAQYPHYGFNRHMGYPTVAHLEALREHGVCPAHRRSFAPVARLLRR